jgi:uncharacterized protein
MNEWIKEDLSRENFTLDLVRDISGALEDVVGLNEASGYFAMVGQMMGEKLHARYSAAQGGTITPEALPSVLVDLKARIGGGFRVEQVDAQQITFVNDACPFGARVEGRRSLCMMTSNVFGFLAAETQGYAKVELDKTIAAGDGLCRVIVHFEKNAAPGREYYGRAIDER